MSGKGWEAQEAVFLNGDIGNFLLFPQKNFPRDKKFPRDKNHSDFSLLAVFVAFFVSIGRP